MKILLSFIGAMLLIVSAQSQTTCEPTRVSDCVTINWHTDEVFYDDIIVMQRVTIKCRNEVVIHYPHDFTLYVFNDEGEKVEERHYKSTGNSVPGYIVDINQCGGPITIALMSMELTMARKFYP